MRLNQLHAINEGRTPYEEQIRTILLSQGVPPYDIGQLLLRHQEAIAEDERMVVPPKFPAQHMKQRWDREQADQRDRDMDRDTAELRQLIGDIRSKHRPGPVRPPLSPDDSNKLDDLLSDLKNFQP